MYLGLPITFAMLQSWPNFRRLSTVIGLGIMCVALAISSFSTTATHLILTQGVLYAIGGSLAYSPTILFVDEWFVRKKGFAFGVMWVSLRISLNERKYRIFLTQYPLGWHRHSRCSLTTRHGMGS